MEELKKQLYLNAKLDAFDMSTKVTYNAKAIQKKMA